MNLLGSAAYDPAAAVSKATSSLLALTAVDTTNLRLAITVPAHGKVLFRLKCALTGATTLPTILLGVLNGATVLKRLTPQIFTGTQNAATQNAYAEAEFIATGLTPGAMNVDAAYGVQVVVASTNIKYGGPNDTTGADAWGAFVFEAWDPQPCPTNFTLQSIDANGRVDVIKIAGTTQTARDLGASVLLSAGTGTGQLDFTSGVVKANATQWLGGTIPAVNITGVPIVDDKYLLGTIYSTPATAGIQDINLKNVANAAVSTSTAQLGVNAVNVGGTAQTGRDIGASVLLSAGTGTGQLDFTSGVVKANLAQILGTALTETAGQIAAAFKKFFNIATPASTMDALTLVATVTNLTNAPTAGDLTATMKTSVTTAATAATPTAAAVTGNVGGIATGGIAAASFAAGAINAAAIATDAIGAAELAADAATEIGTAVWAAAARTLTASLDPTAAAVATAVRTELTTELGRIDVAVSTRNAVAPLDAAGTRSAVGLAAANLDTQFDALPTNAELATALGTADDAVLAQVALVKAKTDNLPASPADETLIIAATNSLASSIAALPTTTTVMSADVKKVNGGVLIGDGSESNRWRPA